VLALALTAAACDPFVPPPVARRQAALEAEDFAVVKALFDDVLRPGRVPAARLLVVDRTMAMCRRDPDSFGSHVGRCVREDQIALASRVLPAPTARALALNFPGWNAAPLSIAASLGDDVVYISPTLVDTLAPGELLRPYPAGSDVVMLTAPAYPAPRMAVIIFLDAGGLGAARLERQPDARWRVAARASHDVD
jgi:hypothetical protein